MQWILPTFNVLNTTPCQLHFNKRLRCNIILKIYIYQCHSSCSIQLLFGCEYCNSSRQSVLELQLSTQGIADRFRVVLCTHWALWVEYYWFGWDHNTEQLNDHRSELHSSKAKQLKHVHCYKTQSKGRLRTQVLSTLMLDCTWFHKIWKPSWIYDHSSLIHHKPPILFNLVIRSWARSKKLLFY